MPTSPKFAKVAAAIAFSPRAGALLSEAQDFARKFGASFSVIHAGERTGEKEAILAEALAGLEPGTPVFWPAGDPVTAIAGAAQEAQIDIVVAGALIREGGEVSGRHFLGTVARGLIERCSRSLLLITRPQFEPRRFRKIMMVTDFSEGARNAFRAALALAEHDQADRLHVIAIRSPMQVAQLEIESRGTRQDDRENMLEEFAHIAADSPVLVEPRVIESATGVGALEFAKTMEADLLVLPTSGRPGANLLPTYMDWVLQTIPCDLWVVRKMA